MRSCSRSAAGVCATVRAGFAAGVPPGDAVWNRLISPQPASASATHSKTGAAQRVALILDHQVIQHQRKRCSLGSVILIVTVVTRLGPLPGPDSAESDFGATLGFEHDPCRTPASHRSGSRLNSRPPLRSCPTRNSSIRGPPRCSMKPRTRIRLFSSDLRAIPAASKAGAMRLEIVTAKSRVQRRPKLAQNVAPACLTDKTLPSTTVNCPILAKISPGLSAFFMTLESAQVPRFGPPRCRLGGGKLRGAAPVGDVG